MFSNKELRGNNSMLGRVQRQQDLSYLECLNEYNLNSNRDKEKNQNQGNQYGLFKDKENNGNGKPLRKVTKAEVGNKRRLLR